MCDLCDQLSKQPDGVQLDAELLDSVWREHHNEIERIVRGVAKARRFLDEATVQDILGVVWLGLAEYTAAGAKPIAKGWKALVRKIAYNETAELVQRRVGRAHKQDPEQADQGHSRPPREILTDTKLLAERVEEGQDTAAAQEFETVEAQVGWRAMAAELLKPFGVVCPDGQEGLPRLLDELGMLVSEGEMTKQAAVAAFGFALASMVPSRSPLEQVVEHYRTLLKATLWPDKDEYHADDSYRKALAWARRWARTWAPAESSAMPADPRSDNQT